ncbi:CBL-interacting protein kinase 16-like [Wolffia australiana]
MSAVGEKVVVLGKYELGRLLGRGSFAKVYLARELSTGEAVAIKVLDKALVGGDPPMAAQIAREASVMRLVRHPHVVHLREILATKSKIFFVMEFVPGGELFALLAAGRLPEPAARRFFRQLFSAVAFCHSRGVAHRDIKPENLLLSAAGDLKVSDFGLAALPAQRRRDGLLHTRCGTPAYVAPEVLRTKGYDGAAADLWSCGVVLFALLAGFLPFQDENLMNMYRKVFKAEFRVPPWVSPGAARLVRRLLVPDPAARITARELALDPWLADQDEAPPPPPVPVPVPAPVPDLNAFELITAAAAGLDLSGLFEEGGRRRRVYTWRRAAAEVLDRVEAAGRRRELAVKRGGGRIRLEGGEGGLAVTAEVFVAAPLLAVAELRQSAGDLAEFAELCDDLVCAAAAG